MLRETTAAIATFLALNIAQAQDGSYTSEQAARSCIHARLKELVAQEQPSNIAADPALSACTNDLRGEFKAKKQSYCEAVAYTSWLAADENSRLNGLQGQPYRPDKAFVQRCEKSESWEKQR